jgi:osmoprotectant transport system substrate-binding protein
VALAVALCLPVAGCAGDVLEKSRGGSGTRGTLVVGSATITESEVLAQLYAQLLRAHGRAATVTSVSNRELYEPALEKGQIDIVPEYAATLTEFLDARERGPKAAAARPLASPDLSVTLARLTKLAARRGLKVLPAGRAVDRNAFAVTREFASRHHLKTLSDLGKSRIGVRLAAGDECVERPYCMPGLARVYGIRVTGLDPNGVGTPQSLQAVHDGVDRMAVTTTTDGTLGSYGLVLLEDDRRLQNADNVLPVVNAADAGSGRVRTVLGTLTRVLTTADLAAMNRQVDLERWRPEDVARRYLRSKGLTTHQETAGRH